MRLWKLPPLLALMLAAWFLPLGARAQVDPSLFSGMRWRLIGPFRGGRVVTVTGLAGEPNVYYFGGVGGGVWKTIDGGLTWSPIFEHAPIGSVGAIAVAPSNPKVIYVGSGEADIRSDLSIGDGMFGSSDGGKTWTHLGLDDSRQIAKILVDPKDPNLVLAAVLGHAYGPNEERGVFRSSDGGKSWQKVLYKDPNTGAIDITFDPSNPHIVYAALWQTHRPPWSVYAPIDGPGGGFYRSTDEGHTWQEMPTAGLPPKPWGRVGLAVAASGGGKILYALMSGSKDGVFRSEDAGTTWQLVGTDPRVLGRQWYFGGIFVDPQNADVVYVANTALYRSTDGGHTWTAFKGAPGGDDYHDLWIAPNAPERMIVGSDQGATLTVDGGSHWTSWYNQPTAQIYHVATDTSFPYIVYGAQQDSGGMAVLSRSDYGKITFRDWFPGWGGESGYILPDPNDPNTVYASTTGGGVTRYDRRTMQGLDISPYPFRGELNTDIAALKYRFPWTPALAIDPFNSHTIYFGAQVLFQSTDRGSSWKVISEDLTGAEKNPPAPAIAGPPTVENSVRRGYGVISTIAPSPVDQGLIWTGSDTGRVYLTRNGGQKWTNVTPHGLGDWARMAMIEPSHFDAGTAYLAINRHRLDDYAPYIYRTHDFGQTWTRISSGIQSPAYVHAVREDPAHRGLLFAGTETGVYVSFDDGDQWQSLQLNLPATPVRDLTIHASDLVVATHGRSFWVLDDIAPLRQASEAAQANVFLFRPRAAYRVRPGNEHGTPLPPEIPAAPNPPEGALINYYLKSKPPGNVVLEILDAQGHLVRRYSSSQRPQAPPAVELPFPPFWAPAPEALSKAAGMHRFTWDLHYASAEPAGRGASVGFGFGGGPWAVPGQYQVRLTVGGQSYTRSLTLRIDPRAQVSLADLRAQFDLAAQIETRIGQAAKAMSEARGLEQQLVDREKRLAEAGNETTILASVKAFGIEVAALAGSTSPSAVPRSSKGDGLNEIRGQLSRIAASVGSADSAPTETALTFFAGISQALDGALATWTRLTTVELPALNEQLSGAGLAPLTVAVARQAPPQR